MAMPPDEYAAKELNVPGWDQDEPIFAPDPNIQTVLNGGPIQPEPIPPMDPRAAEMIHEFQWVLPLELRRAELATELKKQAHWDARTGFWNSLTLAITAIANLVK